MQLRTFLVATLGIAIPSQIVRAEDLDDDNEGDGPEATSQHTFKLDDLIEVAVRLNPDIARAKTDRRTAKGEAGGARRPQAWNLGMGANCQRSAIGDAVPVPPYSTVAEDQCTVSLGLTRNLPSGGSLQVQGGAQISKQEYAIPDQSSASSMGGAGMVAPDEFVASTQITASLEYKQQLLQGFGSDIALAQEHKADIAVLASTLKVQIAAEDLVKDLVTSYWELAYANFEVSVREEALELAKQEEPLVHEAMRAGSAPPSSLGQLTFEMAKRKSALLEAQSKLEAKSIDVRRKSGLSLGRRDVVLHPADALEIGNEEWDADEVIKHAKAANRKLTAFGLQRRIADVDVAVAHDQTRPKVEFTFKGSLIGGDKSAGNAFSSLAQADGFQVMAGLNVGIELGGAAKAAEDAALAKRHHIDIERVDSERQIEASAVQAVHQVANARERVLLSDTEVSVSGQNARAEHASFMAGKTQTWQVMMRQTEQIEARLRRGKAVADYHIAVAQLQHISGVILDQYRINVRPQRGR